MDTDYLSQYEQFEQRHWWFVVRRQIIHDALDRYVLSHNPQPRWLDVGCGSGVLLDSYPAISNKMGLEVDGICIERARAKGLNVQQASPDNNWQQHGTFDLITLADVIEHIEDDRKVIDQAHSALNPGGIVLVTVPALMGLWSGHDVVNHHLRRYTMRTLLPLFRSEQWQIHKASYFSSLLLPMIWAARKWKNLRQRQTRDPQHDFKFGIPAIDWTLQHVFSVERYWLAKSRFPLGSSILLVAQKR
jgi:2-polyprenyl-3-methyl-5-hydroxy-6-metoxy-1,4-benzoquinol methylase